jgi:hypothetical protein
VTVSDFRRSIAFYAQALKPLVQNGDAEQRAASVSKSASNAICSAPNQSRDADVSCTEAEVATWWS